MKQKTVYKRTPDPIANPTPPAPEPEPETPQMRASRPSRIRVRHNYSGRLTGELWIMAGEYEQDDPALMGLDWYLVQNGHADEVRE